MVRKIDNQTYESSIYDVTIGELTCFSSKLISDENMFLWMLQTARACYFKKYYYSIFCLLWTILYACRRKGSL